jgi:hypothetical protein
MKQHEVDSVQSNINMVRYTLNLSRSQAYTICLAIEHREIPQQPRRDFLSPRDAFYQEENCDSKTSTKRRRRNSSSDSSLLENVVTSKLYGKQGNLLLHLPVKRKAEESDTETSVLSNHRRETFEKRPRHKTREDLYEPKNRKKNCQPSGREKRERTNREKKRDRKRASRRAGHDLMQNFSSDNIAQDRLTVRIGYCSANS